MAMKVQNFLVAVVFAAVLALETRAALPEKLRVLTVDLENARVETPGAPGSELSQELRKLLETADVDVLCLQGVADWETCERICKFKPGLRVLTCSAFAAKPGSANAAQVAILARERAILAWVDETADGNSFAMALLQAGSRKLAVFSVQSAKTAPAGSAGATARVLEEVKKLQRFPQNRPDAVLLAGAALQKTSAFSDAGFQSMDAEPKLAKAPEFWIANAGFLTRPRNIKVASLGGLVGVSDFDTASSFASKFAYHTPLLFAGETLASLQPAAPSQPKQPETRSMVWLFSGAVVLLIVGAVFSRQRRRASSLQLVPLNGAGGTMARPNLNDEAVRSNLLVWFKSLFLQRLLSQRQQLLSNEAEATRRTMVIEEKLSTLQTALQLRISAYESRIERLEQELTAATFENRDLIRNQIELLKEKVAKAKEEHSVRRN
jgi:hypothetical protein